MIWFEVPELLLLIILAIWDYRKQEVPVFLLIPAAILPVCETWLLSGWKACLLALFPAVIVAGVLYGISRLTKGQIGEADAYVMGIFALNRGWLEALIIFLIALCPAAIYGLIRRKIEKRNKNISFAFLPFLVGVYLGVDLWERIPYITEVFQG